MRSLTTSARWHCPYSQIFLTGSTGVLGGHLLKEILEHTSADVHCLVRATTQEKARERVLSFLKAYDPELKCRDAFLKRVHMVLGDVTAPSLGLTHEAFEALTQTIDAVIHSAALTNLFVSYRRIQPINEGGTKNIIEFTLQTKSKYLCHISTHTVMGNMAFDKNLIYREADFDLNQKFEHMNYQKTKFFSEKLVREARSRGLKWTIVRPGQIFGDSRTGLYPQGQSNVSGLFYDIFKTVIETGVALDSTAHFDVVPVDYVSKGTLFLGLMSPRMYETYHLTNPDTKGYREVIRVLQNEGYRIRFVDEETYKKLLFGNQLFHNGAEYKSPTTSAFKWWFKKEGFTFEESCITGSDYTQEALKAFNLTCPPVDGRLIGLYVDRAIEQNYFPRRNLPKSKPHANGNASETHKARSPERSTVEETTI